MISRLINVAIQKAHKTLANEMFYNNNTFREKCAPRKLIIWFNILMYKRLIQRASFTHFTMQTLDMDVLQFVLFIFLDIPDRNQWRKCFFRVAVKMMCWTTQIHNKLIRRTNFLSFKLPNFNSLSSPSIEHQKHNFHLHNRTMFVMCAMLYVSDGGRKKIAKMFARVRGRGGDYSRTIENISLFVSSSAPTIFFPLLRCVEMGKKLCKHRESIKKKLWFSAPTHKLARCSPVVVCRW